MLTAIAIPLLLTLSPTPPQSFNPENATILNTDHGFEGMYTDRPSYFSSQTVRVFANWDLPLDAQGAAVFPNGRKVRYRVRKVDRWQPGGLNFVPNDPTQDIEGAWISGIHETPTGMEPLHTSMQVPPMGSFVEGFSNASGALSLGGLGSFTIEGWIYPTQLYDDAVVIAGQGECQVCDLGLPDDYTDSVFNTRGAYLGVTADGQLTAVVDTLDVNGGDGLPDLGPRVSTKSQGFE